LREDSGIREAENILGTTSYLIITETTDPETYNSSLGFKIQNACAFKNCNKCSDFGSCDECAQGLYWNVEEAKCVVKFAEFILA
jgi:hypothetical protein